MSAGKVYYALCRTRAGHSAARLAVRALRRCGLLRGFRLPLEILTMDHAAVRSAMRLWSRVHWSAGDGMMPSEQLLAIYRLAATWPAEGDTVELGAWVGLTTSYLATACRARGRGTVFAVDTFAGTREGGARYPSVARFGGNTLRAFHEQIRRADVERYVVPLVGYTADVAARYTGGPIRVLLIDADHSYDGVRQDFELWSPLVAPGGVIIFHDYDVPEVRRFVDAEVRGRAGITPSPGPVAPNVMAVTKRVAGADRAPRLAGQRRHEPFAAAGTTS
ncbi:MAG: class I SAM-dependent methyltransferase [Planctomycetes bacterium]|nr:class I SAM-dependent methyltransferase [Planctomycetota bacterium]